MFLFVVHSFSSQQAHLLPKYPIVFHLPSFPDLSLGPALFLVAAAASVVSNSVRPHGLQPTRLLRPWDSPGKNTGVGCHFLLQCMKVESESEVAQSCLTLRDPWTAAYQAPPSLGFSGQQYWSGVPLPSPHNNI